MTEKKQVGARSVEDVDVDGVYAARVESGRLLVDAATTLPDGTAVPLDVCFEFDWDGLTPDQRTLLGRYQGRAYAGTVRNRRLLVDEPTALPDGIRISVVEDWPLPPEEQARLDETLERRLQELDAGKCIGIPAEDVIEALRIRHELPPGESNKFEAEYRAELERRLAHARAATGGHITMQDFLAHWRKSPT